MDNPRIVKVEWGRLESKRPRAAGSNARLGAHGDTISLPILRVTDEDGATGFGACHARPEQLEALVGQRLDTLFSVTAGVPDEWRAFEFAVWDWVGQRTQTPVYALAASVNGQNAPDELRAPVYDTSLYFDDLHLENNDKAAALIASEARDGFALGHRAFKLKVGRGARWMESNAGTARDIAVIRAVREAVGPNCPLLIDANNGYTLNLTKHVLTETADCGVFWLEEAFHEDAELYKDLKRWLAAQNLPTLIADGEGDASPHLLRWAREGLIDVVQYDIFGYGFSRWLHLGRQLDSENVRSAPHHYGGHFGNYAGCHLAAAIQNFTYVEWDEAATPGLDASAYQIETGFVHVPARPGFGLTLDEDEFQQAVKNGGRVL